MDLGALQEKANYEIKRFEAAIGSKDYDEVLFLYMSKISEEIGNLAASVLGREGIKAEQPVTDTEVSAVFADTMYSIIILAQKMGINLDKAMQEKMQKLDEEGYQNEEGFTP
ncbi:MazG-like family protein [Candidatus Woesearchaeota archaeon]|nr:MazG-like family protein [Candidatus Woesearchaeota archaeon]